MSPIGKILLIKIFGLGCARFLIVDQGKHFFDWLYKNVLIKLIKFISQFYLLSGVLKSKTCVTSSMWVISLEWHPDLNYLYSHGWLEGGRWVPKTDAENNTVQKRVQK